MDYRQQKLKIKQGKENDLLGFLIEIWKWIIEVVNYDKNIY